MTSQQSSEESRQTLYVRGITEEVDEEILFELFLNAGPVKKVSIPTEPGSKRNKNFCFIQFHHEQSVPYAIDLFKGIKLFGRSLQMQNRTTGAGMTNNHQRTMSAPSQMQQRVAPFVPPFQQNYHQHQPDFNQQYYGYHQEAQHYGRHVSNQNYGRQMSDRSYDRHRSHERYNDQHHRNDYRDRSHDRRSSSHYDNRRRR